MADILRPNLQNTNGEAIRLVEDLLVALREGRVTTVALITVSPLGQLNTIASGLQGADVYVGCDLMKQAFLNNMTGKRPIVGAA